jgi:hypothetical protein
VDEPEELAHQKVEHFSRWLQTYYRLTEILPDVQRAHDYAQWEKSVLRTAPDEVNLPADLPAILHVEVQIARERFPVATPHLSVDISASATATAVSGSALLDTVSWASLDERTAEWSASCKNSYAELSKKYEQQTDVRSLLQRLNPKLADEFDFLIQNIASPASGFQRSQNSANSMRNLLAHYKGDLWSKARNHSEQRARWALIMDRLCKFPNGSPEFRLLIRQEGVWNDLHSSLTNLTKNIKTKNTAPTDIDLLYARFLDHVQQVLALLSY